MGQDGRGAGMRSPLCNLVLFVAWVNMLSTYSAAAVQSSADSPSSVKSGEYANEGYLCTHRSMKPNGLCHVPPLSFSAFLLTLPQLNMLSKISASALFPILPTQIMLLILLFAVHLPYATSKGPGEPTWNDAAPADAKRALMASMPKSNPNHPHHTSDWHNPNARTRQLVAAAAPAVPGSTSAMTATTKQYFGTTWLSASVCQNAPNRTNSVQVRRHQQHSQTTQVLS